MEIDVKGGERDHIKALCLIISIGGERILRGREFFTMRKKYHIKDPRCLVFKRREVTCLQEGKDMFIFDCLH